MKQEDFEKYYVNSEPLAIDEETISVIKSLKITSFDSSLDQSEKSVSKNEAVDDVRIFFEILKYCYSGYEFYKDKVNFIQAEQDILSRLPKKNVTTKILGDSIYKVLSPYINDSHFSVYSRSFQKLYNAYFTSIIVELQNGRYVVIKGNKIVKKGVCFSYEQVKEFLFETLPAKNGNKRFLLGVYTQNPPKRITVGEYILPLHRCKTDKISRISEALKIEEIDGIPIVNHFTYSFQNSPPSFDEYQQQGLKYKDSKYLIWSVLSNGGGNSNYPMKFIQGLNRYAIWKMDLAIINSPILSENQKQEKSYSIFKSEDVDLSFSKYAGKLFVLQNKKVASSGEAAILYGHSVKNGIFVGSASMGCGQFGDMNTYRLPHSNLIFYIGYKVFNMDGFEEGKGLLPDYWLDSSDPVKDMVRYIKEKEEYEHYTSANIKGTYSNQ